jgi:predicted NAD/FAD-binding protein
VAGLTAAHLLARTHRVTLFEADARLGGHVHTHDLVGADEAHRAVDSGFIVHNDRTYPLLRRLFAELGIETRPTEMSMSVQCRGCGLEYAGGRGAGGVLAQPRRAADPRFLRMLREITRFHREAATFLGEGEGDEGRTYGDFLAHGRFSRYLVAHYAVPLVACVWSTGRALALDYPARYLFRFLEHHGMLAVGGSPRWRTVVGGSATYVRRIAERLPDVRTSCPVVRVARSRDGVEIRDSRGGLTRADRVVIATHPDQALRLLADPSAAERQVLGAFGYSGSTVLLHTDTSVLPGSPRARASWNYTMASCEVPDAPVEVSYWMNRLQGIDERDPFLVTLNDSGRVRPDAVLRRMEYRHPVYTRDSVAAQRRLAGLATDRTVYAGAYHGWGFHEDGCRSGVEAAARFGVTW